MEQLEFFEKDLISQKVAQTSSDEIVLTSKVEKDEYTQYIEDSFDLHVGDVSEVRIPKRINLESLKDWNIGVICGASGSGKSTILNDLAIENGGCISNPCFDISKSLISNFDNMTPQEATMLLSSMGLASVPTWIRPYNVLSNGEQYRASLAKAVGDAKGGEIIFVDEYTSVVDRNVAKAMSNALQKYVRNHNKRIVLATCHYDIFEWLRPDWIYDLNKGGVLERGDYLRQSRPKIELQVYRTTTDTWQRFKKYHYMTQELNSSATCFVFTWQDKVVAFHATLPLPSGTLKNAIRGSRTVVLPDFQGFGIGQKITNFIAGIYVNNGNSYYTKTVNPAFGVYMDKSQLWQATPRNGKVMLIKDIERNSLGGVSRPSYCYKYVGEAISGYEDLLLNVDDIKNLERTRRQQTFDF